MDYEWDAAKATENLRRHGIDFADSIAAIEDPNRLEEIDDRFDYGRNGYGSSVWQRDHPVRRDDPARRKDVPHHLCPEGYAI